jgi:hydroxymethylbilane synthase
MLPAAGQGIIAIEILAENQTLDQAFKKINLNEVEQLACAERAFNRALDGGCHTPVGALATFKNDEIMLTGLLASQTGSKVIRKSLSGRDPEALGSDLATLILERFHQN